MVPSAGSSSDEVNRLKREFEQELKRREDRVKQLENSLSSVRGLSCIIEYYEM